MPDTHDPEGGVLMTVADVVALLLDPSGEPRDGVTISGGEPSAQPSGLLALLRELTARGIHSTVYSGFTFEILARRSEPDLQAALALVDLLIDGPYVSALSDAAGEWRGSRNQRVLPNPAARLAVRAAPDSSVNARLT